MTRSTGTSGFDLCGSPPSDFMPSRMAARSTTAGTPVKSCISTRARRKPISLSTLPRFTSQSLTATMSSRVTERPSSKRSRFSSRTFMENGRAEMPVSRSSRRPSANSRRKTSCRPSRSSGMRNCRWRSWRGPLSPCFVAGVPAGRCAAPRLVPPLSGRPRLSVPRARATAHDASASLAHVRSAL